jgi:hypothetical protein
MSNAGVLSKRSRKITKYECKCPCHFVKPGKRKFHHRIPCCELSPCGIRILYEFMVHHLKDCEKCRTIGEQAEP